MTRVIDPLNGVQPPLFAKEQVLVVAPAVLREPQVNMACRLDRHAGEGGIAQA
jgi:hypothetical protein